MVCTCLGLGSNLGDRRQQINGAIAWLAEIAGTVQVISDFHETLPWGYQSSNPYLNAAVQIETPLSPHDLLSVIQKIEFDLGRTSKSKACQYTDRPIDIDILIYGDLILHTPGLVLPHPLMHKRLFVLQPLSEIAPNVIHPVSGRTISELYHDLLSMQQE
ncbi:MAG: 2-amino-4-hydroxy-6-hydroxymethyldihydropteridine diphosphokinase [Tannerella sp.]|jgi:2-amino-4-hydroxy-6-hydroxymethyldihydropteridine diphosphokinase|nr:2-amino-4-hydroxy-6-hydroxymethyldihydropteridine diphosphokinase [Tannerella sp.]